MPNNQIPLSHMSLVARNILAWGLLGESDEREYSSKPEFLDYSSIGGINNQYNFRMDYTASEKQRIFARFTFWKSDNVAGMPFHNGPDQRSSNFSRTLQDLSGSRWRHLHVQSIAGWRSPFVISALAICAPAGNTRIQ